MTFISKRAVLLSILALMASNILSSQECWAKLQPNSNALVQENLETLVVSASSQFPGWPVTRVVDGNLESSWFSKPGDSANETSRPWIQLTFDHDVTVKHVTIMGNRESSAGGKYSVLLGRLEFFDEKGTIIYLQVGKAEIPYETQVPYKDIDYVLFFPISNVRAIRFSSLQDEGSENWFSAIGIAEVQAE